MLFCELCHPFLFVFDRLTFSISLTCLFVTGLQTNTPKTKKKYYNKCIKSGNYHNRVPLSVLCLPLVVPLGQGVIVNENWFSIDLSG